MGGLNSILPANRRAAPIQRRTRGDGGRGRVGVNRYSFLLESLRDLDARWAASPLESNAFHLPR
jgi:hypothetical protein